MRPRPDLIRSAMPALALALALLAGVMLSGCKSAPPPALPRPVTQQPLDDPCVNRLHDLAGQLLIYYVRHGQLPQTLDELAAAHLVPETDLKCPLSGQPYVYDPSGIRLPDVGKVAFPVPEGVQVPAPPDWLIVYDASPVHAGHRWGIVVSSPYAPGPMTSDVVAVTELELQNAIAERDLDMQPQP